MSGLTQVKAQKVLDMVVGTREYEYSTIANLFSGLLSSDPADGNAAINEFSGGGYTRKQVAFSDGTSGSISNTGLLTYPTATADWGLITYIGLFDASVDGSLVMYGPLTNPQYIATGDTFSIPINNLTVTLS